MQSHDIPLQNFALSAKSFSQRKPRTGVGWNRGYNKRGVCTKKGHEARRREGDKCFSPAFFILRNFFVRGSSDEIQSLHRTTMADQGAPNILYAHTAQNGGRDHDRRDNRQKNGGGCVGCIAR